jgi:phosphate starvation-inducible protein PhoH
MLLLLAPFLFPTTTTNGESMSKIKRQKNPQHFQLRNIKPMTQNQEIAFQHYDQGKHLMLHGVAGTGKTFIGLFLALEEVMRNREYQQVVIVRSVVPSRDIGFLPGSAKDKAKVYEEPYYEIVGDLFGRGDAYDVMKNKEVIKFVTTSHLRGTTFRNSVIVVDEWQNMTFPELDTIITRIGGDCKMIFCGDIRQTDLMKDKEKSGLLTFKEIVGRIDAFAFVEFGIDDIVRSELVRQYIVAKLEYGIV